MAGILCAIGLSSLIALWPAFSQGIASSNAPAAPRAKASGQPFRATFTEVGLAAGVAARFIQGDPQAKKYIVEANGTGVALVDYDRDGRQDILLVNGSGFRTFAKGSEPTSHLYRNEGAGRFRDVTREAGITRSGWGNGVCAGDYDNDGSEDLFLTYWGVNSLYRNLGGKRFEDVAVKAGVAGAAADWSTGCTFVDYDRDGRLDLLVTGYAGFDRKTTPLPGAQPWCTFKGAPVFCGPRGLPHGKLHLYRNTGDGRFEDASIASGVSKAEGGYAFTATAADLNSDGWVDLYVACDSTPSLYFRNNKDGTFREIATETGIAYSEHGAEQAGMGVAVGDYDGDGRLDLTKTNFIRDYPNLYRNMEGGFFEDKAFAAGMAVNPNHVLWGVGLEDFDNDGWRDIFHVGGHVYPNVQAIDPSESYASPRLLYRNLGNGRFEDVSALAGAAIGEAHSSRGAAFGDFDNDGDLDVLVMNMGERASLLRNDQQGSRNWLKVELEGTKSNRSAIGSTVEVHAAGLRQASALLSQSSFLSHNDRRLHFGLGTAEKVDKVVVRWASGTVEEFASPPVNSLVRLVEGSGQVKRVELPR